MASPSSQARSGRSASTSAHRPKWTHRSECQSRTTARPAQCSAEWRIRDGRVSLMRARGVRFRNDVVQGPGGKQVLVLDPSGNLVELFEQA